VNSSVLINQEKSESMGCMGEMWYSELTWIQACRTWLEEANKGR
jgi:hypothetical protein